MNTFPALNRESGKKEKETSTVNVYFSLQHYIKQHQNSSCKVHLYYINHIVSASLFFDYKLSISSLNLYNLLFE